MKINKILKTSLLVGSLCLPIYSYSNAQEKSNFYLEGSIKYEKNLINTIDNIPLQIRTIPRFPYPPWDSEDGLVVKENFFSPCERISLGAKIGNKFHINKNIEFILGLGLDYIFNAKKEFFKKRDVEDFDNEKKANTKKALCEEPSVSDVYFSIHPAYLEKSNDNIRPLVFSEIEIKVLKKVSLGIGAEFYKEKLILENGWNRSGITEKNKVYELANFDVGKIYSSIKLNDNSKEEIIIYSLDFGLNKILKKSKTELGKNIDLEFNNNSWFVGFKVGQKI